MGLIVPHVKRVAVLSYGALVMALVIEIRYKSGLGNLLVSPFDGRIYSVTDLGFCRNEHPSTCIRFHTLAPVSIVGQPRF